MVKIATFNTENLFARYKFRENVDPLNMEGFTINDLAFDIYDETSKQITAAAIKATKADVLALQEVESLPVLDRFNSRYLGGQEYKYRIVIDAFDPRMIDVAVLSKYPIVAIKTYRQERNKKNSTFLFSRDCLQVTLDIDGKPLIMYVNHFKSMIPKRSETKERRQEQVERVASIVKEQWEAKEYKGNFVVLGDFNDYIEGDTSLTALINHPGLVNMSERLPEDERWTHYWAGGNESRQLDFILLSKSLGALNSNKPEIMRKGLPWRADKYTGERLDNVGENHPKASDHCPLIMDLKLS